MSDSAADFPTPKAVSPRISEPAPGGGPCPRPPNRTVHWAKVIWGTMGLLVLVVAAYWPLGYAGFIWDDSGWLTHNRFVHHWTGLTTIWLHPTASPQYYPLVFTAFLLQYKLWGANALAYHVVNILLQLVNGLLLWRILGKLGLKSAWLIAAIFAIHPVQVETVGWVVEQKSLLSALFYFAAVLAWMRFAGLRRAPIETAAGTPGDNPVVDPRSSFQPPHEHAGLPRDRGWSWYALASLFYLFALLAKTDACTLPAVLLLLLWWKRGRLEDRDVNPMLAWFGLGLGMAIVTVIMEHTQSGARGAVFHFSWMQRLLIAGKDLWFYPWKLIWPHPLLEVYPRWRISALGGLHGRFAAAGWQWLFPITAFAVPVALLLLHRRIGRGPFTAVAFYGLTISPVLGFISFYTMRYTFVADHYQYLACIGLIALVVEGFRFLVSGCGWGAGGAHQSGDPPRREPESGNWKRSLAVGLGTVIVVVLAAQSWRQSWVYRPPIHVWTHVLKYDPTSYPALEHVGVYECNHGHLKVGMAFLNRSFRLSKGADPIIASNLGDIYYKVEHRYAAAVGFYRQALEMDPDMIATIIRLVNCYERLGHWNQAFSDLARGLHEFPRSAALHFAFGNALAAQHAYAEAVFQYHQVLRYEPDHTKALYNLALTLEKLDRRGEALRYFARAVRVSPQFALGHFEYGKCLLLQGQPAAAAKQFRIVIRFWPNHAAPYRALARALNAIGRRTQAAAALARAAQLHQPTPSATTPPRPFTALKRGTSVAAPRGIRQGVGIHRKHRGAPR